MKTAIRDETTARHPSVLLENAPAMRKRRLLPVMGTFALIAWGGAFVTAETQRSATHGAAARASTASAAADEPRKTVWDGVYSDEQAEKGRVTYSRACGSCHKQDMSGDAEKFAPPLTGPSFTSRWNGRPLSDLYLKVAKEQKVTTQTMMKPKEINETLVFILKANGMPAGETKLTENFEGMRRIAFTATRLKRSDEAALSTGQ